MNRSPRAFTLVELLIALLILVVLLTSAALAIRASMHSFRENDEIAAATQAGRAVLDRITRDVRTAAAVDLSTASNELILVPPDDGRGLDQIHYEYIPADGALLLRRTSGGTEATSVLVGGSADSVRVSSFAAEVEEGLDGEGLTCAKRVTLHLALQVDGHSSSLCASAAPRRNRSY